MGELVFESGSAMKLDVIVAGNAGKQNGVSAWVDSDNHIDVAARDGGDFSVGVDTANKDVEGIFSDV